jgi:Fe-Mn family superoxide dismutase
MFEHSYHLDFGAGAAAYVDAYMRNVRWEHAASLYERCTQT